MPLSTGVCFPPRLMFSDGVEMKFLFRKQEKGHSKLLVLIRMLFDLVALFNSTSTFVGYLIPK